MKRDSAPLRLAIAALAILVAWALRTQAWSPLAIGRTQAVSTPAAREAYARIYSVWKSGDQLGAETLLDEACAHFPRDQRLALFQAACVRSRFEVKRAYSLFVHVQSMDPDTAQGRCAGQIAVLDTREDNADLEQQFGALQSLVKDNPSDPILLWMIASEC